MQTLLTTLIVLMAAGYLAWQWWPRRAPASAAQDRAAAGCSSCSTCGSCGS
jgi:hypothetical protein